MNPASSPRLRLLIVDDHQVVRMGLRLLEQDQDWLRVVGEAATAEEALRLCDLLRPDAVIMDIRLAGGSGTETCRKLKQRQPEIKVLMLTSFLSEGLIIEAIDAGADGYLLKECDAGEIVRALQTIMRGGIAMSPEISQKALRARVGPRRPEHAWVKELNVRELRILGYVAGGLTNKEIASELELSPQTVRNYLERIFLKMDVERRSAAAVLYTQAKAAGLLGSGAAPVESASDERRGRP
jgi:DNA-binding NarL/FixJ family response regulator